MTQKEYVGLGTIEKITEALADMGSKNILLVTGRESYSACGAQASLNELLKDYQVEHFFDFQVNPKIEDVQRGIDVFLNAQCDTVIAVGGGSVIDTAKAIIFLAVNPTNLGGHDFEPADPGGTVKPLIAIPTTVGSGSEATRFSILYVDQQKQAMCEEEMLPKVVIIDGNLLMSLPENQTAATGIDSLAQGIESYWNVHSTDESKAYAVEAIELAAANVVQAVTEPTVENRLAMARSANIGGKAINITRTTACHAVSYPMTSFFNIPHGHAVGLTLSSMLVYNSQVTDADVLDERGADYVRQIIDDIVKMLGCDSVDSAAAKIDSLMQQTGLEIRLSELDLKEADVEKIITYGFNPSRVKNNPRLLTEEALREILKSIY